jgi:ergothioneine biosynthesis protein EgtC
MCRLLGYFGETVQLEALIAQPTHSLVVQSYQPREMTSGLINADGFGVGWYDRPRSPIPFTYKNTLPIWSDPNLIQLNRYVHSDCILANVRSATLAGSTELSNCQPFSHGQFLGIHNGFIQDFRRSLYRPLRAQLDDRFYQSINGNTDSEHILALFFSNLESNLESKVGMVDALSKTLSQF